MKKLLIIGAGGYGQTVADVAAQLGCYETIRFLDDGKTGPQILGRCQEYAGFLDEDTHIYPAFGSNELRMRWLEKLLEEGRTVPTLVHPRAYVSPRAALGTGTVVLPMAVVNTGTEVGRGCILNIGCLIDHDCIIEDGVHLCAGVVIKAENRIRSGSKLESGEVVFARVHPV